MQLRRHNEPTEKLYKKLFVLVALRFVEINAERLRALALNLDVLQTWRESGYANEGSIKTSSGIS
ncbi:hypothetical protein P3T76_011487 [Phytophthora citrophthora]|uniref:Uncharacterized protein n=1 Tax=Phytophthora citrophthora TaxID=4793 RepID=A0AAD9LGC6_9STRA|nr:hypothetical protein P3T76_011487 [Phytophthora citrophthora]